MLYLRVYASNVHPKHFSSFMYFLFPSYSLSSPPSNPPVFFSSSSTNSDPFSFAAICLLWLQPKWIMSWKISSKSPAFPVFSWLFPSLAFSKAFFLSIYAMLSIAFWCWELKSKNISADDEICTKWDLNRLKHVVLAIPSPFISNLMEDIYYIILYNGYRHCNLDNYKHILYTLRN